MIKLRNVCYSYSNGNNALKNINLNINSNEVTLIIGKNGSGKSTLANVISNIFISSKGSISIDNQVINKKTKSIDIRKKINIVFQNPSNQIIFNRVFDDIEFTLNNLKIEKEKINPIINKSLKLIGMLDHIYDNPFELSLGQKQKIAIANVLAINPKYIVFDESTSMLDASSKKDIYNIINTLKKEKKGIIFVTNNLEEILIADKIIVLENGKIKKQFYKNEMLENIDNFKELGLEIPFILKVIMHIKSQNKNFEDYSHDNIINLLKEE